MEKRPASGPPSEKHGREKRLKEIRATPAPANNTVPAPSTLPAPAAKYGCEDNYGVITNRVDQDATRILTADRHSIVESENKRADSPMTLSDSFPTLHAPNPSHTLSTALRPIEGPGAVYEFEVYLLTADLIKDPAFRELTYVTLSAEAVERDGLSYVRQQMQRELQQDIGHMADFRWTQRTDVRVFGQQSDHGIAPLRSHRSQTFFRKVFQSQSKHTPALFLAPPLEEASFEHSSMRQASFPYVPTDDSASRADQQQQQGGSGLPRDEHAHDSSSRLAIPAQNSSVQPRSAISGLRNSDGYSFVNAPIQADGSSERLTSLASRGPEQSEGDSSSSDSSLSKGDEGDDGDDDVDLPVGMRAVTDVSSSDDSPNERNDSDGATGEPPQAHDDQQQARDDPDPSKWNMTELATGPMDPQEEEEATAAQQQLEIIPSFGRLESAFLDRMKHATRLTGSYHPGAMLKIMGVKGKMYSYQHTQVWWHFDHEGRYEGIRVGGVNASATGMGKSRIMMEVCTQNHLMCDQKRRVQEYRANNPSPPPGTERHLAQDCTDPEAKCPSDGEGLGAAGINLRCCCEPSMKGFYRGAQDGLTTIITKASLLHNTVGEFNSCVDVDAIQARTGKRMQLYVGHHTTVRGADGRFEDRMLLHKSRNYTPSNWASKDHPDSFYNIIADANGFDVPYHAPPRVTPPPTDHIIALTTPHSLNSRVLDHCNSTYRPSVSTYLFLCPDGVHCPKSKNPSANHKHYGNAKLDTRPGAYVGRFFWDESHLFGGSDAHNSGLTTLKEYIRRCRDCGMSTPSIWQVTATPNNPNPSDPLAIFMLQRGDDWDGLAGLSEWTPERLREMSAIDNFARSSRTAGRMASSGFKKYTGVDPPDDNDGLPRINHFTRHYQIPKVVNLMRAFYRDHLVRLTDEDRFGDQLIVELPPQEVKIESVQLSTHMKETVVNPYVAAYAETSARVATALELKRPGAKKGSEVSKLVLQARDAWRTVRAILCLPSVAQLLSENEKYLYAFNMEREKWWSNPQKSPLWDLAPQLVDTSPKLKLILKDLRRLPETTETVPYHDDEAKEQVVDIRSRPGRGIAINEPFLLFSVWVALIRALEDHYPLPADLRYHPIRVIRRSQDVAEAVRAFELKPDPKLTPEQQTWGNVIIFSTEVASIGLSLLRAERIYQFDLVNSPATDVQVKGRNHRIGQKKKTQFIQLVVEDPPIEKKILSCRESGREVNILVLTPNASEEAGGPTGVGGRDAPIVLD